MRLTNLRVNDLKTALGVGNKVYFSWVIESENEHNILQTAYQITVSDAESIVWNSGKIDSEQSIGIMYEGAQLKSSREYRWQVIVWDNCGHKMNGTGSFETAILDKNEWKAKWAESNLARKVFAAGFGNQQGSTLFRKEFDLKKKPKKVRAYVTCHGIYQLSINGNRVDDREFAPEHTTYEKYLCYQTYNITKMLHKGRNAVGMEVADGWYSERKAEEGAERNDYAAVLFQILVEYEDSEREIILSDKDVRVSDGAVISAYTYTGELYDARMEQDGWCCTGFNDAAWSDAVEKDYGYNNLVPQEDAPVIPVKRLPVKDVIISPRGETILDFGQNIAGTVEIRCKEPAGTKIGMTMFEVLDKEGNYFDSIFTPASHGQCQKNVYISNGKESVYHSNFVYYGFRYVKIEGIRQINKEDFIAVVLSSNKDKSGDFVCSDRRLNKLYENTVWSQTANMISIPTDCPQREKAGWTGDIAMYCRTACHNEMMTPFLRRWLENLACEQGIYGEVPVVVPYDGRYPSRCEYLKTVEDCPDGMVSSAGWGDAAILVPYEIYHVTGNAAILNYQYDSMKAWADYIIEQSKTHRKGSTLPDEVEEFLWNTGFHFGEWLIPSESEDGYDDDAYEPGQNPFLVCRNTAIYTAPVFGWNSVKKMSETALAVGNEDDAVYYSKIASKMKAAIQKGVIDDNGNMPVEKMGAYALMIYFDLVPERYQKHFSEKLCTIVEQRNYHLDTGFLSTPFLLDALCKIGRTDLAYKILLQDTVPSWLYEVEKGATTVWESWYSYDKEENPLEMSFNHYAYGCVAEWMYRYIGGIDMLEIGYKKIRICPKPDASITSACRSFKTGYGYVRCNWKKEGDDFQMDVEIPCNTTAEIYLPDGTMKEVGSGKYTCTFSKIEQY
ncbi:MAG: family 78 glycoside hydrolase catalytic domain [Eubacteriales bacterium]|nr:family 78 glycoside hydrolase catalytic domain [Eubacteriales bacterium]